MDTTDFSKTVTDFAADAQAKAKTAFDKGAALIGEAGQFAKGNVEAIVESGKAFATGVKQIAETNLAEGKSAFEVLTEDAKKYAAVKSPADFFQLHGEVLRRQFDSAVALSAKNTEAAFKLANAAFAPLSARVNVAVETVKKAA